MPLAVRFLGEYRTLIWGLILAVLTLVGFGFTSTLWAFCILLPLASLTDLVPPTLTAMAANRVGEDRQGLVQGVIASLGSLAAVAAPIGLTGVFRQFADRDGPGPYLPGAPFLVSAVIVLAILPVALRERPRLAAKGA